MDFVFTIVSIYDKPNNPFVGDTMSHKKCINR